MAEKQPNLDTFLSDFQKELFRKASELTALAGKDDFFAKLDEFTDMVSAASLFSFIPRLRSLSEAMKEVALRQNNATEVAPLIFLALSRMLEIMQESSNLGWEAKGSDEDIFNRLGIKSSGKDVLIISAEEKRFALSASEVIRIIEPGNEKLSGLKSVNLGTIKGAAFAIIVGSPEKSFAFLCENRPYLASADIKISGKEKYAVLKDQKNILFLDLNALV